MGDSGSGKTYFFNTLLEALNGVDPWKCTCYKNFDKNNKLDIRAVSSVSELKDIIDRNNLVIVLDEVVTEAVRKQDMIGKLRKSKNYFVLLDRQLILKLDTNVNAVFKMKEQSFNGYPTFKTEPFITIKEENIADSKKITHMITEDTGSGKLFWQSVLSQLNLLEYEHYGNGSIVENIEKALQKMDGDLLIALDYDEGAVVMQTIYNSEKIDKNRIHFIPLESFEEVICNSDFILSKYPDVKDYVINYKKYITPLFRSTGNYFSSLLFNYVKVKPPKLKNSRNITKFYEKGAEYFKECFIDDCCVFNKDDCSLFYDKDKKTGMLANKFERYRKFI